jgi:chromosome partitioning protein
MMDGCPAIQLDDILACWKASRQAAHHSVRLDVSTAFWLATSLACQMDQNALTPLGMIIAIANSKGGVGKSTLAVHLAAWLHEQGHSVVLADCDTQHSSSEWMEEAAPGLRTVRLGDPDTILDELPLLARDCDFVVADGPGSNTETSRALLLRGDFAIFPCKASMLEVRALAQATSLLRQAQDIRGGDPEGVVVLSMVGKQYRLTQDMRDAADALNLRLADTPVILRQIYADAPGQGALVWNMGARGREAADEIRALCAELLPAAVKAKGKQSTRKRVRTPELAE